MASSLFDNGQVPQSLPVPNIYTDGGAFTSHLSCLDYSFCLLHISSAQGSTWFPQLVFSAGSPFFAYLGFLIDSYVLSIPISAF